MHPRTHEESKVSLQKDEALLAAHANLVLVSDPERLFVLHRRTVRLYDLPLLGKLSDEVRRQYRNLGAIGGLELGIEVDALIHLQALFVSDGVAHHAVVLAHVVRQTRHLFLRVRLRFFSIWHPIGFAITLRSFHTFCTSSPNASHTVTDDSFTESKDPCDTAPSESRTVAKELKTTVIGAIQFVR